MLATAHQKGKGMARRRVLGGLLAVLAMIATPLQGRAATSLSLPNSIAASGDSITRAFDVTSSCFLQDCPQDSWSTGDNPAVASHYLRLLALNPGIAGHQLNFAKTGAKVADLPRQLYLAGYYHADYVTVLIGANDLCTSSAATMTPTNTFAQQFYTALAYYFALNPNGHVFVSSIPDLLQLWTILHTSTAAVNTWTLFNICQSMLARNNTDADRQKVVDQEAADNYVLGAFCQTFFANCRWDGYAAYNARFPASEASTIDYFHPNVAGQADLAATTWKASYWGG
jgi:lysophospholipase L1-like esterase